MAISVSIGEVYIDNLVVSGEVASEVADGLRGVDVATSQDIGYSDAPEEPEAIESPSEVDLADTYGPISDRYDEAEAQALARRDFLRNVAYHVDRFRHLEGLLTNHERRPKDAAKVRKERQIEERLANESLARACGQCVFSGRCGLENDADAWANVHPFKYNDPKRKFAFRKGGTQVKQVESREDFGEVITEDPAAHCDPAARQPRQRAA